MQHASPVLLASTILVFSAPALADGPGVAIVKEQPFHLERMAKALPYTEARCDAGVVQFTTKNSQLSVSRGMVMGKVDLPPTLPANIFTEEEVKPLRVAFGEMSDFSLRFKASTPLLSRPLAALKRHLEQFDAGKVRSNGQWMDRVTYARLEVGRNQALEEKERNQKQWDPVEIKGPSLVSDGYGMTFQTLDGRHFQNVELSRAWPDGISVFSNSGVTGIPFENLPPELALHYGLNKKSAEEWRRAQSVAIDSEPKRQESEAPGQQRKREEIRAANAGERREQTIGVHWQVVQWVHGGALCHYGLVVFTPDTRVWSRGQVIRGSGPEAIPYRLETEPIFIAGSVPERGSGWLYPEDRLFSYTNPLGESRFIKAFRLTK